MRKADDAALTIKLRHYKFPINIILGSWDTEYDSLIAEIGQNKNMKGLSHFSDKSKNAT